MPDKRPKLVIIGAGIAGTRAASLAAKSGKFEVITVEPKDFLEIPYSTVRAVVLPITAERSLVPLSAIGGGVGQHIVGSVEQVKMSSVVLASGQEIAFDYCIMATGATYSQGGKGVITPSVMTLAERKKQLLAMADRIKAARSVVVVGGGPVGIELMGEIVDRYAGKQATLVHAGPRLLEGKDIRMHNCLMIAMRRHNVQVLLSDRAATWDETRHVLTTKSGQSVPAEVVIWAAGSRPNTQALIAGGELAPTVDANGFAKVDPFLRLEGTGNIFVLGDSNNTPQVKLGYLADLQARLTVSNLLKLASGSRALAKWTAPLEPQGAMLVTFGRGDGVGHVRNCICTGWFVSLIKGRDLFLGKVRGGLGVKGPSIFTTSPGT